MDYRIRRRADACEGCARPFEQDQAVFSTILLEELEPRRRDLCVPCFESCERDPEREFAFWKTRRAEAGKPRRVVDFEALRELFFRMAGRAAPEYRKLSYLLALVLVRKRVLRLQEFVTDGGRDFLVVTSRHREQPQRIEAPELREEDFAELRERLRALLDLDVEELAPDPGDQEDAGAPEEGAAGESEAQATRH